MVVEELKRSFGVRHVKDYGACIVIPKGKFNIEWATSAGSVGRIKKLFSSLQAKTLSGLGG